MQSNLIAALEQQVGKTRRELKAFLSPVTAIFLLPCGALLWLHHMHQTASPLRLLTLQCLATPEELVILNALLRRTKWKPRVFQLLRLLNTLRRHAKCCNGGMAHLETKTSDRTATVTNPN